jgi:hypothetical protein
MINARKQIIIFPSSSWQSISHEYECTHAQLSSSLSALIPYHQLLAVPLVSYRIDPHHPETKKILEDDLNTQKKLKEICYNPCFLEIILEKLAE